jgi:GT2 family glycosyltransferase
VESNPASNGISMVIPTYNSSRFLSKLLVTVEKNGRAVNDVEVLVVDDSFPGEAEATKTLCAQHGARYLWCEGNVARKRNFGIEHASHQVVFFTDSDCELAPSTLAEHLKLHNTGKGIGAMYGLVEFSGETNWVWSVVERTGFLGAYSFARRMQYAPWGGAGNLSVKRHVLQEIGGFDETFLRAPGGEDVDLGLRINEASYKIACNPDAVVYHTRETWNTLWRMLRRVFGYGRAHYHLLVKHSDHVGYEYPRLAVVFFFLALLLIFKAVITQHWLPLVGGMVFVLTVLVAQATMLLLSSKHGLSLRAITTEMVAHGLDLTFEWGIIYESLRHLDTRGFWAKMIYAEKQLVHERERKIIQCWSLVIGFLVLLFLA